MKSKTILLLIILLGSLFITTSIAGPASVDDNHVTPNQDDDGDDDSDDTDTEEEDDKTETEDEKDEKDEDLDDDGIDDDTEEAYEREVQVEESDREWKIESELKNQEQKDKFEAEFKIGGGDEPELELKYATEASSTETEMKYRVNFDQLIEFTDDGIAGYQDGNDTMVSSYELDKAEWNVIAYSTDTLNGSNVYTATATTADGIFTLVLKLSTGITKMNSTIVTPNAIKIDVIINGYNYQGNNTYLTLQTDIKTESETEFEEQSDDEEHGFAQDESQIKVSNLNATGFFSWVKTAQADGLTVDVISSYLNSIDDHDDDIEEGERHDIIFFTFDAQNPDKIVWDPKIGVSNDDLINQIMGSSVLDSLPFSPWAILAIFVIPIWYKRRQ